MMRGWRWLLMMVLFGWASLALARPVVVELELRGAIGPASSDYFTRALKGAQARGAAAVVLRMDTPGGLDSAMREIVQAIIASPVPVITYVSPGGARAASAGAYILLASHVAAMAPGTNVGAATPVQLGGSGGTPEREPGKDDEPAANDEKPAKAPGNAMERKLVNDATAYIRSLADLRGRNADWAERAVREAASLSAGEALEQKVIDLVAEDLDRLLAALDGREVKLESGPVTLRLADAEVQRLQPDWRTKLLAVLTDPNVAYILMLVGIYGLIFELANPGSLVPGVLGGICLLLALFAFQALPINYAGLALMLLGMAFMVGEVFVPSFGILGIGGVVAFVIGSVILFDSDSSFFSISMGLIAGFALVSLVLLFGIAAMAVRAHRRPVVSGDQLIGAEGEVLSDFTGHGRIRLQGEIWNAIADEQLRRGDRVRVVAREGLRLRVVRLMPAESAPGRG